MFFNFIKLKKFYIYILNKIKFLKKYFMKLNSIKPKTFDWNQLLNLLTLAFGGPTNIKNFYNCATRLRVHVYDEKKVNLVKLKQLALVKGVNKSGDQFQIIFGAGTVNKVTEKLTVFLSNNSKTNQTQFNNQKKIIWWDKRLSVQTNLFLLIRKGIRGFAEIFIPLIPIFIVGGLALAIGSLSETIAKSVNSLNTTSFKNAKFFFDLIGGTILGSLPVFVGYTAMKKFNGTPMLGVAIGLIMVAPSLINGWLSGTALLDPIVAVGNSTKNTVQALFPNAPRFFSWMLVGYQAQVFPVLLIIAIAAGIERILRKFTPEAIAILLIPLATVFFLFF